jgi:hypothetical protein
LSPLFSAILEGVAARGVDIASFLGAVLYVRLRRNRLRKPPAIISQETGEMFFSGLALLPLALLTPAAFSDTVLQMLTKSSRLTFAAAGIYSLLAILEDRTPARKRKLKP